MYTKLYDFFSTTFIDIVGNITNLFDAFFVTTIAEHIANLNLPQDLRDILAYVLNRLVPFDATLATLMFGVALLGVLIYSLVKWAMPF